MPHGLITPVLFLQLVAIRKLSIVDGGARCPLGFDKPALSDMIDHPIKETLLSECQMASLVTNSRAESRTRMTD